MTRRYLFIGLLATSLSLLGCGRGSNNPADGSSGDTGGQSSSFTLGGTTYATTSTAPLQNNVQQTIDGRTVTLNNFVADAFGVFFASENGTGCFVRGTSSNASITLVAEFPGRATGNFQMNANSQAGMVIIIGNAQYGATSAQLTITEYGNPGGRIRGTFSGTFTTTTGTNVQVTNGSFAVTRASDLQ